MSAIRRNIAAFYQHHAPPWTVERFARRIDGAVDIFAAGKGDLCPSVPVEGSMD